MVDRIVSLWLNVACEFKRAGFLEGEAIGTSLLIGLQADDSSREIGLQAVCISKFFRFGLGQTTVGFVHLIS